MNKSSFTFWQKWLTYANVVTIIVGLLVAFAGDSFVFQLHNEGTQDVFFNGHALEPDVLQLKKWLFGIIGGTIVGFHVLMVFISENAFKNKELWAYRAMWFGLLTWFCIDSAISMSYGAIHNVIMINLVALFIIGLPLVMTRNEFKE